MDIHFTSTSHACLKLYFFPRKRQMLLVGVFVSIEIAPYLSHTALLFPLPMACGPCFREDEERCRGYLQGMSHSYQAELRTTSTHETSLLRFILKEGWWTKAGNLPETQEIGFLTK